MKKKQVKDDELLYLPSSLNDKNDSSRRKHEFDFAYSNHKNKDNYTLSYDTNKHYNFDFTYTNNKNNQSYDIYYDPVKKKAIEFVYSNHKNEIDYGLYYTARQNYKHNMLYSNHRNKFEHYLQYGLKRRLNYIFEYFMYPRYGRYIFIYDITSVIHNEDNIIRMDRCLENTNYENTSYSLYKGSKSLINNNSDTNLNKSSPYDIVYNNVTLGLDRIDKTIEEYCGYLNLTQHSVSNRKVSLFSIDSQLNNADSNGRDIIQDDKNIGFGTVPSREIINNEIKSQFAKSPVRHFTVDKDNIEFAKVSNKNVYTDYNNVEFAKVSSKNIQSNTLYDFMIDKSTDSKEIANFLKNDITMRKIVEDMYVEKMAEMYFDKNDKDVLINNNELFNKKDIKSTLLDSNIDTLKNDTLSGSIENTDYTLKDYFDNSSLISESQYEEQFKKEINNTITNESLYSKNVFEDTKNGGLIKEDLNKHLSKSERYSPIDYTNNMVSLKLNSNKDINESNDYSLDRVSNNEIKTFNDMGLNRISNNNIKQFEDMGLDRISSGEFKFEESLLMDKSTSKGFDLNKDFFASKTFSDSSKTDEDSTLSKAPHFNPRLDDNVIKNNVVKQKDLQKDFEERLNLHKRFWFVKAMGKVDYKILPNVDYAYPADINIFVEKPDYEYLFEYDSEYVDIKSDSLSIELYDYNYKRYENFKIDSISNGEYKNDNIIVNVETDGNKAKFKFRIKHKDLYYIIVRQPLDINGYPVLYTATKKFLGDNKHPIPFGEDMGVLEIPVHINIMVDFINILLLIWSKFYYQFTGYTGIHAVYGLVNLVYEWLTLETSDDIYELDDYYRCFRWLRWEAEKVYNLARYDANLSGNAWVEQLIYELIEYMEMHHMDDMPIFEPNHLMDEYRNIFDDPSFDIDIVLDKVKGVRKRVIDTNKIDRNQKNK